MLVTATTIVVLGAACAGGDGSEPASGDGKAGELIVQVASYEVTAGSKQRVIVGLLMPDQRLVSFGTVDVEFFYLGTEEGRGRAEQGPSTTAEFLAIPGTGSGDETSDRPIAAPASTGRGVYSTEVEFDRAGFWSAQVTAEVSNEGKLTGNSVFEVVRDGDVPEVGEPALKTENLLPSDADAPPQAVDSRAKKAGEVPDEVLHRVTIAESIERGEPALVVFATPVYCVSRFCGPITDMVEDLARKYGERANFIHVEIWRNYEGQVINKAAADWLLHGQDLTEPWVFFIGADGTIEARWDNVATPQEIEPYLKKLPRL